MFYLTHTLLKSSWSFSHYLLPLRNGNIHTVCCICLRNKRICSHYLRAYIIHPNLLPVRIGYNTCHILLSNIRKLHKLACSFRSTCPTLYLF